MYINGHQTDRYAATPPPAGIKEIGFLNFLNFREITISAVFVIASYTKL